MFNSHSGSNAGRHVDDPRNYRVRLSYFGPRAPGDFKPSPLTAHVAAASSIQARLNAQANHPGYTVTDVM